LVLFDESLGDFLRDSLPEKGSTLVPVFLLYFSSAFASWDSFDYLALRRKDVHQRRKERKITLSTHSTKEVLQMKEKPPIPQQVLNGLEEMQERTYSEV